jgi:flagellar basal body P-ring formation protein FlgA
MGLLMGLPSLAVAQALETRVREAALAHLETLADAQEWGDPVFSIEIPTRIERSPHCARPLDILPLDTRQMSRMRFEVVCPAERDGWRETVVVRARVSAAVVVAATAVPARQPIQATDLRVETRDITTTPDAMSHTEDVEDQTSRRALRPGQVVQKRFLLPATMVRRGATVQIVADLGSVRVVNTGESLENGVQGQIVRVRNNATGTVIEARVVDHGTVEPVNRAGMSQSPD